MDKRRSQGRGWEIGIYMAAFLEAHANSSIISHIAFN